MIGWLAVINISSLGKNTLLLAKLDFVFASCLGLFFSLLSISYKKAKITFFNVLPSLVIFLLLLYLALSKALFVHVDAQYVEPVSKIYYFLYISLLIVLSLGVGGITLLNQWRNSKGIKKLQISYLLVAFVTPFVLVVVTSIYNVFIHEIHDDVYVLITNVSIVFTLLCSKAIFRYRLLDLRQAVSKVFVSLIIYVGVAGIALIFLLKVFSYLTNVQGANSESVFIVLVLLAVGLAYLLRQGMRYIFKTIIFPPLYKTPKLDAPVLKGKPELPLQKLMAEALPQIQKQFQVKEIGFLWYNRKTGFLEPFTGPAYKPVLSYQDPFFQCLRQFEDVRIAEEILLEAEGVNEEEANFLKKIYNILEKNSISMLIPFGVGDDFLGAIALGKRKGGSIYSEEDVAFARKIRKDLFPHIQTTIMYYNAIVAAQKQVAS